MQAGDLVQLAALVARHAPAIVASHPIPETSLFDYWTASKCRHDRWSRAFQRLAARAIPRERHRASSPRALIAETLLSEALVRVWSGTLAASDSARGISQAAPVGYSVYLGQMEARQRALELILQAPGISAGDLVWLNGVRRKVERWSDLFLGQMCQCFDVAQYAVDPVRARQFAADLWTPEPAAEQSRAEVPLGQGQTRGETAARDEALRWSLLVASLDATLEETGDTNSGNGDLNEQIAASIVVCLPDNAFEGLPRLHSLWGLRMLRAACAAQKMLDDLWREEGSPHDGLRRYSAARAKA